MPSVPFGPARRSSQKNALEMAVDDLNEVGGVTYALTVEDDAVTHSGPARDLLSDERVIEA